MPLGAPAERQLRMPCHPLHGRLRERGAQAGEVGGDYVEMCYWGGNAAYYTVCEQTGGVVAPTVGF